MINIYQISLSNTDVNTANRDGFNAVLNVDVKCKMMLGARKWEKEFFKYYTKVYEVDTGDLEHAFEITNLWEEDHLVTRLVRGSSTSVGDIFEKDGTFFVVDSFGFKEVEVE